MDEVKEVLAHRGKGIGHVTRIMLDNMVVPLGDGDVDVSMLKQADKLVDGQVETEVMCSQHIFQALYVLIARMFYLQNDVFTSR